MIGGHAGYNKSRVFAGVDEDKLPFSHEMLATVRRVKERRYRFTRFELSRTRYTNTLFSAMEAESKRCEEMGIEFHGNRYIAQLVEEALAMRKMVQDNKSVEAPAGNDENNNNNDDAAKTRLKEIISEKQPIPPMDRYHKDRVFGSNAVKAYTDGVISLKQLTNMYRSAEELRLEILDNAEVRNKIIACMVEQDMMLAKADK